MHTFHQELAGLNSEQRQAVGHINGPMLVLAGAGSGKTRVATFRIAHLISSGISCRNILGLTFTNKAAQEMKERVQKYVQKDVLVSTFHSLGARLLRESIHHMGYTNDFAIYDEDDSERLLKEAARDLGASTSLDLRAARSFISSCKNKLGATGDDVALTVLYERYNAKLKACNAVDFDDLLLLPVKLFNEFSDVLAYYQDRWQYILVDEYQDTNEAQYTFVKLLCGEKCNLFVVGDPDQSIYSWRGANVQNILNFEKDFSGATVVRLEQNYRSTNTILEAANAVIKLNSGRYEKNLWSALGDGEKIALFAARSEREEARFVGHKVQDYSQKKNLPLAKMCLFYRTNFQSRVLEDELISRRIPYTIVGGISFYLRKEIKDILSMLRLIDNPKDLISFLRIVNLPKRGLGDTTLEKIQEAQSRSDLPILDFMLKIYQESSFQSLGFTLTAKQKDGWSNFAKTFLALKEIAKTGSLEDLVRACIFETGYVNVLSEDSELKQERMENAEELIVKAAEWELSREESEEEGSKLSAFLTEISLTSSLDQKQEGQDVLTLMTVHNGKGLEYDVVFLLGLEEDLFPHINSKKTPEQVEEERRLFYVGITRARRELFISYAQMRALWGATRRMRPSRFLMEIPSSLKKVISNVSVNPVEQEVSYVKPAAVAPSGMIFSVGDTVFHPQFGVGKIENASEGSLGLMYEVYFTNDETTRKLVAKFAPLQPLAHKR